MRAMTAAATPRRVIGYLRKSVVTEGRPGAVSWQQQESEIRRVASMAGDDEVELLSDWGKSGGWGVESRRPDWLKLLAAIRAGEVAVLYTYDESRLSRSAATLLELYRTCAEANTRIVSAQGGELDFSTPDGNLVLAVKAGIAQYVRDQASARASLLVRKRLAAGEDLGMPFYGDRPGDDWPAVIAAYEEAGSFTGAARLLNERGVAAYRKGKFGWYAKTVRGVARHRAPEMIPERLARGSKDASGFRFGGVVRCPCGSPMRGQRRVAASGETKVRYQCHMAQTVPGHVKPAGIREDKVLEFALFEGLRELPAPEVAQTAEEELRGVLAEQDRLTVAWVKGRMEEVEYEREYAALAVRGEALEAAARQGGEQVHFPDALNPLVPASEANTLVRRLWKSLNCAVVDGVMKVERAEWVIPERRGPLTPEMLAALDRALAQPGEEIWGRVGPVAR